MEEPEVIVASDATAWLQERGGVLTLRRSPRYGCCGGRVTVAVAEARAPHDLTGFDRYDTGDLVLYIESSLTGPLHVGLDRLFGLRSLYVEGAKASG